MEYLTHILSFLAGLGAGYVLKIRVDSRRSSRTETMTTQQASNKVGGHQAGRDIVIGRDSKDK